jgi:hypothetical protein
MSADNKRADCARLRLSPGISRYSRSRRRARISNVNVFKSDLRSALRNSSAHETANTLGGVVDRANHNRLTDAGTRVPGRLQGHRHRANHLLACSVAPSPPQDDACTSYELSISSQHRKDSILGVRPNVRGDGSVFADHVNAHRFNQASARPTYRSRASCCSQRQSPDQLRRGAVTELGPRISGHCARRQFVEPFRKETRTSG